MHVCCIGSGWSAHAVQRLVALPLGKQPHWSGIGGGALAAAAASAPLPLNSSCAILFDKTDRKSGRFTDTVRTWVRSLAGGAACTLDQWNRLVGPFSTILFDLENNVPVVLEAKGAHGALSMADILCVSVGQMRGTWAPMDTIISSRQLSSCLEPAPHIVCQANGDTPPGLRYRGLGRFLEGYDRMFLGPSAPCRSVLCTLMSPEERPWWRRMLSEERHHVLLQEEILVYGLLVWLVIVLQILHKVTSCTSCQSFSNGALEGCASPMRAVPSSHA